MKPAKFVLILMLLLGAGYLGMFGGLIIGKPASPAEFGLGLLMTSFAAGLVWIAITQTPGSSRRKVATGIVPLFAVWVLGSAVFGPVFVSARVAHERTTCLINVKKLAEGMHIYLESNNDVFPPAERWYALTGRDEPPRCPYATSPYSYGMNRNLSSVSAEVIEDVANTVLVFEMTAVTADASGTEKDQVIRRGHTFAAMVDGYATYNSGKRWKP